MRLSHLTGILAVVVLVAACGPNPDREVESLRKEITDFRAAPTDELQGDIERRFVTLDQQIDELDKKGRSALADGLRSQVSDLRTNYEAARLARAVHDAQKAIKGFGDAIKDAGRSIGDALRSGTNAPADSE